MTPWSSSPPPSSAPTSTASPAPLGDDVPSSSSPSSSKYPALLHTQPPSVPPHLQSIETLEEALKPITLSPRSKGARITNWGGTFTDRPTRIFEPWNVAQCLQIIELARRTGKSVRAVGKAHSPSDLMMSDAWSIRTLKLAGVTNIDAESYNATFLSGTLLDKVSEALLNNSPPLALSSLGSISGQTIGGLLSTATHGSGYRFPAVSAYCQEIEIIVPLPPEQGGVQLLRCNREQNVELFNASLCGIGSTGFITTVTMKTEPAFRLRHLTEEVPFDDIFGPPNAYPGVESSSLEPAASSSGSQPKVRRSIGQMLADGQALPPPNSRYLPVAHTGSPAEIWPVKESDDGHLLRATSSWQDSEDDDVTREGQVRIEELVQTSQHTRLWWFPHVGMVTLGRADRTLEAAVPPSLGERVYHQVVGFQLTQFLLFISRYHSSLPPRVARTVHWLTHPSYPASGTKQVSATETSASSASPSSPPSLGSEYSSFQKSLDRSPSHISPSLSLSSTGYPTPLSPRNPSSVQIDHSPTIFNMDCLFPQYTNEWFIPFEHTSSCLRALRDWLEAELTKEDGRDKNFNFPIEIRFVDADGIYLSPSYARKSCVIGIIQFRPYNTSVRYRSLWAKFEALMRHYVGRPHWAKTHTCGVVELTRLYPRMGDWLAVREKYDPEGVLLSPYVRRHLLGEVGEDVGVRRFKKRERGRL